MLTTLNPALPTTHLPGTAEHRELMRARARAGLPLQVPGDVVFDPLRLPNRKRLRNGRDRVEEYASAAEREAAEARLRAQYDGEKVSRINDAGTTEGKCRILAGDPDLGRLAANLRFLRREKRMSLRRVALGTGLSVETVRCLESRREAGRARDPRLSALWALASLYKVSIDELVGRRAG
jgi:hypothetical protein